MAQQDWSTVASRCGKRTQWPLVGQARLSGRPDPEGLPGGQSAAQPHAHALIEEIDTENAEQIPGVAAIFTYRDVPQKRFTMAGQTYPEPSPYDRLILDRRVRFVGDAVAIVAGENERRWTGR